MAEQPRRVRVEEIDWQSNFPFLQLCRGFRIAFHPPKLLLALALIVSCFVVGWGMDVVWGDRVYQGELAQYANSTRQEFEKWCDLQDAAAAPQAGIFSTILAAKTQIGARLVITAASLQFIPQAGGGGFVGAVRAAVNAVAWLFCVHPFFAVIYGLLCLALAAWWGGALSRLCAAEAAGGQHLGLGQAVRFVRGHYRSFLLAPLLPIAVIAFLSLLVCAFGLLFNFPGTDVIGGMLFVVPLVMGLLIVLALALLLGAGGLYFPAVAVDGADLFDANSRSGSYLLARPWRLLFYSLFALVYGAITIVVLGVIVYAAIAMTQHLAGAWVFREAADGVDRFDAILPPLRQWGLGYRPRYDDLGIVGSGAAILVAFWVYLLLGLLLSYVVSYYFTAQTLIYLLLRQSADGTEFDELYQPQGDSPAPDAASPAPAASPAEAAPAATAAPPAAPSPPAPPANVAQPLERTPQPRAQAIELEPQPPSAEPPAAPASPAAASSDLFAPPETTGDAQQPDNQGKTPDSSGPAAS